MAESLAKLLRGFRSAARLSQEALAERADISTRTVSDIEAGVARTPRLITLVLLADALQLSDADRSRLQAAARRSARASARLATAGASLRPVALVGRDAHAAEVCALLIRQDVRLVTLCGPAGVGKTSLALRVAFELSTAFANGVAVVELAPVADPAFVASTIAQTLGLRESADSSAPDVVADALRARAMLLVLDNLEHLTPAAPWIAELVDTCPKLVVLGTSREPLHVRAERVYSVRPLDTASASELFVRRAQATSPEFAMTSENEAAVRAIVQRLEGLPLAIELAAPRLRLLPPKALAARLERRLPLLGDGAIDLPHRQQTMRAAIAWSYDLLAADEQDLFRRLAVLQGGGSLDAARAVTGYDEASGRPFLLRVAALVDKNLLSLEEDPDGEPRVTMLEILREYGFERLSESDQLEPTRSRHANHVFALCVAAERELSGADQARWLGRLEREHRNVRAALQWALDKPDVALGQRLSGAVWRFWWMRGYLTEGRTWLGRFLDHGSLGDDATSKQLRARALRGLVVLLSAQGNLNEALAPCEEAISLQRESGDDAGLGASLTSYGIILQFRGELESAKAVHEEALAIRRRIGDELGTATSLSNLAAIAYTSRDTDAAQRHSEESAAIYRRLGHTSGISHALTKLGLVAAQQGDYVRAERLFEEALHLQRSIGNSGSMFFSLINLGSAAQKRGHLDVALQRLGEALDLLGSVPNKVAIAGALEGLASVITASGDAARAARIFGAAEGLRNTLGSPRFPSDADDYDAQLKQTRETLGDAAFYTEWQIGASMTLERALEDARSTLTEAVK